MACCTSLGNLQDIALASCFLVRATKGQTSLLRIGSVQVHSQRCPEFLFSFRFLSSCQKCHAQMEPECCGIRGFLDTLLEQGNSAIVASSLVHYPTQSIRNGGHFRH